MSWWNKRGVTTSVTPTSDLGTQCPQCSGFFHAGCDSCSGEDELTASQSRYCAVACWDAAGRPGEVKEIELVDGYIVPRDVGLSVLVNNFISIAGADMIMPAGHKLSITLTLEKIE